MYHKKEILILAQFQFPLNNQKMFQTSKYCREKQQEKSNKRELL